MPLLNLVRLISPKDLSMWNPHCGCLYRKTTDLIRFVPYLSFSKYRKVASSRPVCYSIFEQFWGATRRGLLNEGY